MVLEKCNFLPERGRSATLQARSASRSAAPDPWSERKPERRSANPAGAHLERRSGFCRSANTLDGNRSSDGPDVDCLFFNNFIVQVILIL